MRVRVASHDLGDLFDALAAEIARRDMPHVELCVIGGTALNAAGLANRPTKDVDVVGLGVRSAGSLIVQKASPFPEPLVSAVTAVARQFGLPADWLNCGPTDLIDHGLPPGFEERLSSTRHGATLTVHYASRLDQICFKTFAAADSAGRHLTDLLSLGPTEDEMRFAVSWVRNQDDSAAFTKQLALLLGYLGMSHVVDER